MPSKKKRITVYLSQEEYDAILASANRAKLSLSTFSKRVCLGTPVPSLEQQEARLELRRLKGDLGRLGGLFKQCLTDNKGPEHELRRLLREIDMRQKELKEVIDTIH